MSTWRGVYKHFLSLDSEEVDFLKKILEKAPNGRVFVWDQKNTDLFSVSDVLESLVRYPSVMAATADIRDTYGLSLEGTQTTPALLKRVLKDTSLLSDISSILLKLISPNFNEEDWGHVRCVVLVVDQDDNGAVQPIAVHVYSEHMVDLVMSELEPAVSETVPVEQTESTSPEDGRTGAAYVTQNGVKIITSVDDSDTENLVTELVEHAGATNGDNALFLIGIDLNRRIHLTRGLHERLPSDWDTELLNTAVNDLCTCNMLVTVQSVVSPLFNMITTEVRRWTLRHHAFLPHYSIFISVKHTPDGFYPDDIFVVSRSAVDWVIDKIAATRSDIAASECIDNGLTDTQRESTDTLLKEASAPDTTQPLTVIRKLFGCTGINIDQIINDLAELAKKDPSVSTYLTERFSR